MNDVIQENIEISTKEQVRNTGAVHVIMNETLDERDSICAISERESQLNDTKQGDK